MTQHKLVTQPGKGHVTLVQAGPLCSASHILLRDIAGLTVDHEMLASPAHCGGASAVPWTWILRCLWNVVLHVLCGLHLRHNVRH